jgi:hypothetical protein
LSPSVAPSYKPSSSPSVAPSYKPSSSPTDPVCPCFNQDDLSAVTSDNVSTDRSNCVGPATLSSPLILTTTTQAPQFEVGSNILGVPICGNSDSAVLKQITAVEQGVCSNLIINRCTQVGYPWGN